MRWRPPPAIAVALPGRTGPLGSLTLLTTSASGRQFTADDVSFVVELGVRAGTALDGALLHERVVATSNRMAALQRFTARLASAVAAREVIGLAVDAGADVLAGNSASLCLVDEPNRVVNLVSQRSMDRETLEQWQQFPLDASLPACDAIRALQPVVLRSLAERDERYPALEDVVAVDTAFVVVPLLLDDHTALGALDRRLLR